MDNGASSCARGFTVWFFSSGEGRGEGLKQRLPVVRGHSWPDGPDAQGAGLLHAWRRMKNSRLRTFRASWAATGHSLKVKYQRRLRREDGGASKVIMRAPESADDPNHLTGFHSNFGPVVAGGLATGPRPTPGNQVQVSRNRKLKEACAKQMKKTWGEMQQISRKR